MFGVAPNVQWALTGIYAVLVAASVAVWVIRRANPETDRSELVLRVKSWWVMVIIFTIAMVLSRTISIVFMGLVSFLALKEYLSLIPTRRADRRVLLWIYLAVPIQYYWIAHEWYGMFIIFVPIYMFLLIPMLMVLIGETQGYLRAAGTLHWGLMTTVFSLGHAAYLLVLPGEPNPAGGGPGLLLFLVFLTQFNDVAQYFWGKLLGKRKALPSVSPGKTQAGVIGGVATTIVLAWLIAPWLTPLSLGQSLAAGALIGMAGFIGDVTISAVQTRPRGERLGRSDTRSRRYSRPGRQPDLLGSAVFHFVYYLHY